MQTIDAPLRINGAPWRIARKALTRFSSSSAPDRRRIELEQRLEGAAAESGDDDVEPPGHVVCSLQRRRQFDQRVRTGDTR
jgi:hypothetical protein